MYLHSYVQSNCHISYTKSLKHVARGPHVAHEDILCGPQ